MENQCLIQEGKDVYKVGLQLLRKVGENECIFTKICKLREKES